MELETFIKVFIVCSLGAMSPGPSWVLIINNALVKGKLSGYITSIGHGIGIATYAFIANLSIGLVLNILTFCSIFFAYFVKDFFIGFGTFY